MAKFSAAMLYIPHGNAESEQIFSLLSLAKKKIQTTGNTCYDVKETITHLFHQQEL